MTSRHGAPRRTALCLVSLQPRATTTSLLLLLLLGTIGCAEETPFDEFRDSHYVQDAFVVDITPHNILPTVATVTWSWTETEPDDVWLELVAAEGATRFFEATATDGGYTCTLMGLKPLTEYTLTARMEDETSLYDSVKETLVTGGLPSVIPETELSVDTSSDPFDGFLVTSLLSDVSSAVILDRDGDFVWWHTLGDVSSLVPRARMSNDGQSVVYMWTSMPPPPQQKTTELVWVGLNGNLIDRVAIDNAHHDFELLPDGTIAILVSDTRIGAEGGEIVGDSIVEWNPDTGTLETIWSSWDTMPVPFSGVGPEAVMDWTHANALDHDPHRNTYSVSLFSLSTIVTIDRATGEIVHQVGGYDSDFELLGTDNRFFDFQHQFEFIDDHLLVFDNGLPETMASRVVEFTLDADAGTAKVEWTHSASPTLFCPVQGDVNRFDSGATLVTWSTSGRQELVSANGETVWQLDLALGGGFGYTSLVSEINPFGR